MNHAMTSAEGTALRVQLDALLGSLERYDRAAMVAGDVPVQQLLARLWEARQAASEIETRPELPPMAPTQVTTLYRGVRLAKR
jgi:hypothetical protein